MHASDLIQHEDTSGTTQETSHQCYIMRKAMSKEVGAGGRFDIFLDSAPQLKSLMLEKLELSLQNFFPCKQEVSQLNSSPLIPYFSNFYNAGL